MAEKSLSLRVPLLAAVVCSVFGVSAGACGDDDHSGKYASPYDDPESNAGVDCEQPEPCDIDETECQQTVLELTACMRGDETPKLPKVRVITQDDFRAELQAQAKDMNLKETPWDSAFKAIGLSEPGMSSIDASIDEQVASILAFYRDDKKDVTIIKEQMAADDLGRMYVLSHELTHYLQDRESNLSKLSRDVVTTLDSRTALGALIEGEATANSSLVASFIRSGQTGNLAWRSYFDDMFDAMLMQIDASPSPLFTASQSLPYPVGGDFVANSIDQDGRATVDRLFSNPHIAFIDWVSRFGDSDSTSLKDLQQDLDCAPPLPPKGMSIFGIDSFGAAGAIAFLSRGHDLDRKDILEIASHLRADAIAVYAKSSAKDAPITPVAVAWRLRFTTNLAATDFASEVERFLPSNASLITFDREVLITSTDAPDPATPTSFDTEALNACPTFKDLAPPASDTSMSALRSASFSLFEHRTQCAFADR